MWTTNGTQADWMCLLANTVDGPAHKNKSLICLPMKTKGVQVARKLDKLGMRSSDTAQIFFEDVRVPQRYRIGEEGEGFTYQMLQFQEERLYAARPASIAKERMIEETIAYTGQRKAFGQSILDNQVVHFRLAELKTEVEMLRALTYRAAELMLKGEDVTMLASMAKLKSGRLSREISDACLQYWGGMGFMNETADLARLPRHAARLHRRRRRRDHAVHHLQAHGHPAGQAEQVAVIPEAARSDACSCPSVPTLSAQARGSRDDARSWRTMTHETLIVDRDGPVLKVTLNRPEVRNALSPAMVRELAQVFERGARRCRRPRRRAVGRRRQLLRRRRPQGHGELGGRARRRRQRRPPPPTAASARCWRWPTRCRRR